MQSIDAYVSRPSVSRMTLRARFEGIRELCDLAFVARSRLLDLQEAGAPAQPRAAGWLQRRREERTPRQ